MNDQLLKIGIIGYRGFGAFCTAAFHDSGLARVMAYAGRDSAAMRETAGRYGVERTYTDWRALTADPDIQLVHIATPPDSHAEMAVAALNAGKHVLIEKPIATTQADADAILLAAKRAGAVAGINYVMRYDPLYEAVAEIARHGWLGALTHAAFQNYASDEGLNDSHWFWSRAQSGGIFVEHGVHFFDVIGGIIGSRARSVTGQAWLRGDGTNKEDRVQATVTHANGVTASYYHAFNRPGALEKQLAHFAFERGHVTLHGWIPTHLELMAVVDSDGRRGLASILDITDVSDPDIPPEGREIRGNGKILGVRRRVRASLTLGTPDDVYRKAVVDVLADVVAAIQSPGHQLRVGIGDGAESLRVALAAREAADTGRMQEL